MNTQPEALRLADAIDPMKRQSLDNLTCSVAAAELRRLHEANQELLEALHWIAEVNAMDYEYQAKACAAITKHGGAA